MRHILSIPPWIPLRKSGSIFGKSPLITLGSMCVFIHNKKVRICLKKTKVPLPTVNSIAHINKHYLSLYIYHYIYGPFGFKMTAH